MYVIKPLVKRSMVSITHHGWMKIWGRRNSITVQQKRKAYPTTGKLKRRRVVSCDTAHNPTLKAKQRLDNHVGLMLGNLNRVNNIRSYRPTIDKTCRSFQSCNPGNEKHGRCFSLAQQKTDHLSNEAAILVMDAWIVGLLYFRRRWSTRKKKKECCNYRSIYVKRLHNKGRLRSYAIHHWW